MATRSTNATRKTIRVAFVTCAELADLDPDDRLAIAPLGERGIAVEPAVWDDPRVDWAGFDLAVLRSTWDYPRRRDDFVAWSRRVPALANPAEVVAWNTDKRYLAGLAAAGLAVVPTEWLEPGTQWTPPPGGEYVVKPAVSGGSIDSGRYDLSDPEHRMLAVSHVDRLLAAGRVVMVQPYLPAVDSHGETALIYFDGAFSHAIRKGPLLTGPDEGVAGLYKVEDIGPRTATPAERALGDRVLAQAPPGLLYARVDLIPGTDGQPLLVELELTEPSIFLGYREGAPDRFAAAIAARF